MSADPSSGRRAPRAAAVLLVPALLLACASGCASTPRTAPPGEGPREVLERFLAAVDRGDIDAAYGLLSGRWRARLTPAGLRRDLEEGGALARDRLERARLAARGEPVVEDGLGRLPAGRRSIRAPAPGGRSVEGRRAPGGSRCCKAARSGLYPRAEMIPS